MLRKWSRQGRTETGQAASAITAQCSMKSGKKMQKKEETRCTKECFYRDAFGFAGQLYIWVHLQQMTGGGLTSSCQSHCLVGVAQGRVGGCRSKPHKKNPEGGPWGSWWWDSLPTSEIPCNSDFQTYGLCPSSLMALAELRGGKCNIGKILPSYPGETRYEIIEDVTLSLHATQTQRGKWQLWVLQNWQRRGCHGSLSMVGAAFSHSSS